MQQRAVYNRTAMVQYALRHWNNPNPDFANMDTRGGGGGLHELYVASPLGGRVADGLSWDGLRPGMVVPPHRD